MSQTTASPRTADARLLSRSERISQSSAAEEGGLGPVADAYARAGPHSVGLSTDMAGRHRLSTARASSERAARGRHALHRVPVYDADSLRLGRRHTTILGPQCLSQRPLSTLRPRARSVRSGVRARSACAAMLNRPVVVHTHTPITQQRKSLKKQTNLTHPQPTP